MSKGQKSNGDKQEEFLHQKRAFSATLYDPSAIQKGRIRQRQIHDLGLDVVETLDSLHPDYEAIEVATALAFEHGDGE